MAAHYAYLEEPTESGGEVVAWFRAANPRVEARNDAEKLIHFSFGPLVYETEDGVDERLSPIVTIIPPRVLRGVLWTVGSVIFRPVLRESGLLPLNRSFTTWLKNHELVFENKRNTENRFAYYLEGGAQNFNDKIYALPTGATAVRNGQYFVSQHAKDEGLDTLCRALRLRGVECSSC